MTDIECRWGGPGEQYRLSRIHRTGETSDAPEEEIEAPAPGKGAPIWDVPPALKTLPWFEIIFGLIGLICVVISIIGYVQLGGTSSTVFVAFLATIPLFFVIALLIYIDRWEPEPLWTKAVAFFWGAGVAIVVASIINSAALMNAALVLGDENEAMRFTAVIVAPLVEETFKATGVLLVVAARRTTIHSLLDGIVYAGFAGAGFAFIEDMQYFLEASAQGTTVLTATVVLRGLFSPFVHPMATSCTGFALAWALLRSRSQMRRILVIVLGWSFAVFVHGLWNYFASLDVLTWIQAYVFIEVPLFVVWMIILMRMSAREKNAIRDGLLPYVRTGWVLPAEVAMVTDRGRRKAALTWAKKGGRDSSKAMRAFLNELAALGLDQKLQERRGAQSIRVAVDRALLASSVEHRRTFLSLTSVASSAAGESTRAG